MGLFSLLYLVLYSAYFSRIIARHGLKLDKLPNTSREVALFLAPSTALYNIEVCGSRLRVNATNKDSNDLARFTQLQHDRLTVHDVQYYC